MHPGVPVAPVHARDEGEAVRLVRLLLLGHVAVSGRQVAERQHRLRRAHRRHRRELLAQVRRHRGRRRHVAGSFVRDRVQLCA